MGPWQVGSIVFSRRGVNDFELIRPSSHKEIMEMQCDLLMSNSRDPKTIMFVKGNIGRIFDGSLPHCADSLKLGLKKAFDLKKKERQPPGVRLRCSNPNCSWYRNRLPCVPVGVSVCCPQCANRRLGSYYFQCVGCGYNRKSNHTSCQGCGKKFIP